MTGRDEHAPVIAAVALGSNLGDRAGTLDAAVKAIGAIDGTDVMAVSRWYDTAPVGDASQPRFLNGAVLVRTTCSPRALLDALQAIERAHGRDREREERWGPRTLDLDVLLFGALVVDEPGLTIPHPRLHEREFVLAPLAEIGGALEHPIRRVSVATLWAGLSSEHQAEPIPVE